MAQTEIRFHPEASEEYAEAYEWYASQSGRAARTFEEEVDAALERIVDAPERWAADGEGSRRLVLRRFPYSIIYEYEGDTVWVLAIAHNRRRPGYWRHRAHQR